MLSNPHIQKEINNLMGRRKDVGRKNINEGRKILINPVMTLVREKMK